MGAFDDVAPIILPRSDEERTKWGWEAHETVILKGQLDVSDQEYVANRYGKADKKGNVEIAMGTGRYALLHRMIKSWTFMYNGKPVELSVSNINRLPASYSNPILSVIDELSQTMTEEEEDDFLPSASESTVASPA
jgi:hypothetical protein